MTYRTLPVNSPDSSIKDLVVEWTELLADNRFAAALAMFPQNNLEITWTQDNLREMISGYGVLDGDEETHKYLLERHNVSIFEITTLKNRSDFNEIYNNCIDVDRDNLYGLDPDLYLGIVHFDDVPLSGFRSDLTAQFNIRKVGRNELTLEFESIHVM